MISPPFGVIDNPEPVSRNAISGEFEAVPVSLKITNAPTTFVLVTLENVISAASNTPFVTLLLVSVA